MSKTKKPTDTGLEPDPELGATQPEPELPEPEAEPTAMLDRVVGQLNQRITELQASDQVRERYVAELERRVTGYEIQLDALGDALAELPIGHPDDGETVVEYAIRIFERFAAALKHVEPVDVVPKLPEVAPEPARRVPKRLRAIRARKAGRNRTPK
jgi:hypothetical protein